MSTLATVGPGAVDVGDSAHVLCVEGDLGATLYMCHLCKYLLTSPCKGPLCVLALLPAIHLSWLLDDSILCGCISLMTNDSELISVAY